MTNRQNSCTATVPQTTSTLSVGDDALPTVRPAVNRIAKEIKAGEVVRSQLEQVVHLLRTL